MATYKQGILGSFSGKVGNIVGSSWRGIAYIRSLAKSVKNPRTQLQLRQRALLRLIARRLSPFANAIRLGYVVQGSVSAWNAALSNHYGKVVASQNPDTPDGWTLDPDNIHLSNGALAFPVSVSRGRDNAISLGWKKPEVDSPLFGSRVVCSAYNVANGQAVTFFADASAESASFSAASIATGSDDDSLHIYVFAANAKVSSAQTYDAAA